MGSSKETENSQMPNNDSVDSLQNGNDLVEKIEGSTLVTLEIAKETPQIDEFNEPLKEESDGLEVRKSPPLDTLPQIQIQSPNYMGPQVYSGSLDKLQPRRNPENFIQSNINVPTITITPEKPSEDGYNWRKYGQKFVKGNEFIRSYYKCTYPNCVAKKQVERSNTGPITDINYLGNHEHPQPQHILVQPLQTIPNPNLTQGEIFQTEITTTTTTMPLTITASESYREENNNNTTNPEAKRQKRESNNIYTEDEPILQSKNCNEVRHVVKTMSEVDLVNDGYRWRKYGQKLVKGNPNPRSYYRCSNAGCPVKKHVERASHDIKLVITTYEGQHDHDMPVSRTLTSNTSSSAMTTGSSETGENTPNNNTTLDMVLHISAN